MCLAPFLVQQSGFTRINQQTIAISAVGNQNTKRSKQSKARTATSAAKQLLLCNRLIPTLVFLGKLGHVADKCGNCDNQRAGKSDKEHYL